MPRNVMPPCAPPTHIFSWPLRTCPPAALRCLCGETTWEEALALLAALDNVAWDAYDDEEDGDNG